MNGTLTTGPKGKSCWFPFKRAYMRRKPRYGEYVPPATKFYLQNGRPGEKPVEVELFEYDDTMSQHPGATELVLEGHPMPTDDFSVVAEVPDPNENSFLNAFNANCMSQDFWDDEIVEASAWSCIEESLKTKKKLGPIVHPDLEKLPTSPLPRVEVVHEPRRSNSLRKGRSLDSNSLLDGDKSNVRRAMCVRTEGGLQRPKSKPTRQAPKFKNIEIPEEKKDEDSISALHSLDLPAIESKDTRATPRPRSLSLPPQHPQRRTRSSSSNRNARAQPSGSQSMGSKASQSRSQNLPSNPPPPSSNPFEPSFYIEVEATRQQLDAVRDLQDVEEEQAKTEKNLRRIKLVDGSSSQPDLEMVRKSSLVDDDSAFMRSEMSENRGYLPSEKQVNTPPRNRLEKHPEGAAESGSPKEAASHAFTSKSSMYDSAFSFATSDASASTTSDTTSTFDPPREINRLKSDITDKSSPARSSNERDLIRKPSSDGIVRKMSNPHYKKAMSEKVSRRLRSLGRNQQSELGNSIVDSTKPDSLRRQPISALTTTSDEKYAGVVVSTPSSPEIKRDYVSEITTASRQRHRVDPSIFNKGDDILRAIRSGDEDSTLLGAGPGIGEKTNTPAGRKGLGHRGRPRADVDNSKQPIEERLRSMDEDFQNHAEPFDPSPSDFGSPDVIGSPRSSRRMRSPRSPRSPTSNMSTMDNDIIRSPRSPESVRSPRSQKSADFFDDISGVGTDAFGRFQNDDDDSLFSDLRSIDSSKWNVSNPSRPSIASCGASGAFSTYEKARREKLFRGDLTVQTETLSVNQDGAFACMDKWLE